MIFLNIYNFIYNSYSFFVYYSYSFFLCIYIKKCMKEKERIKKDKTKRLPYRRIKKEYSIYDFEDLKNLTDDEPIMF